jgi:hypothetical protein
VGSVISLVNRCWISLQVRAVSPVGGGWWARWWVVGAFGGGDDRE